MIKYVISLQHQANHLSLVAIMFTHKVMSGSRRLFKEKINYEIFHKIKRSISWTGTWDVRCDLEFMETNNIIYIVFFLVFSQTKSIVIWIWKSGALVSKQEFLTIHWIMQSLAIRRKYHMRSTLIPLTLSELPSNTDIRDGRGPAYVEKTGIHYFW